jgi:hypothetical protein
MKLEARGLTRTIFTLGLMLAGSALAFCGFYVARGDAKLFNKSSQVIIARDGNRTNITMVSDYQGNVKDFAMVVPVPVVLEQADIRVIDPAVVQKLDAYSAPRLVEYFDEDPCQQLVYPSAAPTAVNTPSAEQKSVRPVDALGVTVEAQYVVGEYDIVILSATQSNGLETWLKENKYNIPTGASNALAPYIKMGMKFFVAKVNLENFNQSGFSSLRPLQMSFESQNFMLPLRLGMLNAKSDQDLIVYALTRKGRVESANYNTVNVPSNMEVPEYVQQDFSKFYPALFKRAYERENKKAVFVEYAWNSSWCDPCASEPPTLEQLQRAGAGWAGQNGQVFVTRLHVRYGKLRFKEDLMLRETPNNQNFQGRYVIRHAWKGQASCQAAENYNASLAKRFETQAQMLANLTGWKIEDIRKRMRIR